MMSYEKYMMLAQRLEKLEKEYQDLWNERPKLSKKIDRLMERMDVVWDTLSREDQKRIYEIYKPE